MLARAEFVDKQKQTDCLWPEEEASAPPPDSFRERERGGRNGTYQLTHELSTHDLSTHELERGGRDSGDETLRSGVAASSLGLSHELGLAHELSLANASTTSILEALHRISDGGADELRLVYKVCH